MYSLSFTGFFFKQYRIKNIWSLQGIEFCSLGGFVVASSVAERLCAIQAVLDSIPGGNQIFLILYCLKKACENERIHLMSKRRLRKKL